MHPEEAHKKAWNREHFRRYLEEMFGAKDTSGIELLGMLRLLANLSETLEGQRTGVKELSGPRMHLLLRLLGEERAGNLDGLTPTELSHSQRVNKNSISALLKGLEDQGLIQRNLDPQDRRVFRIMLTGQGREVICAAAPHKMERMNQMVSELSRQEREQLLALLDRLRQSMVNYSQQLKEDSGG